MSPLSGGSRATTPQLRTKGKPTGPTIETLRAATSRDHSIHSVDSAKKFLVTQKVAEGNLQRTLQLGQTLLNIGSMMSSNSTLQDSLRAAVYILLDLQEEGDPLDDMLDARIVELMDKMSEKLETSVAKAVEKSMVEVTESRNNEIPMGATPSNNPKLTSSDCQALTYAMALARSPPAAHAASVAKNDSRLRAILLDRRPDAPADDLAQLSEKILVTKANLALENMGDLAADAPVNIRFRSAKKLRNGGIWLELTTQQEADWLKEPTTLAAFLAKWDGGLSTARTQRYSVIAQSVPITFSPDVPTSIRAVESMANLPTNSITSARWIKPIERRQPEQSRAHLLINLSSPDMANEVMWNGITIEGVHIRARKLSQDVYRCLKCHKLGATHQAANCPNESDKCGTCAGNHRTSECTIRDQQHFSCINCKRTGHAAWDRLCPSFLEAQHRFNRTNPDNVYAYFPTKDPRSWERTAGFEEGPMPMPKPAPNLKRSAPFLTGSNSQPLGGNTQDRGRAGWTAQKPPVGNAPPMASRQPRKPTQSRPPQSSQPYRDQVITDHFPRASSARPRTDTRADEAPSNTPPESQGGERQSQPSSSQ